MSAYDCQISPHRSMREELAHQSISISPGLCEKENSRRKAIDAVNRKDGLTVVS